MIDSFNNNNEGDSSIYLGILRAEDLSEEEKLNALKGAANELARQDLLRRLEYERQVSSCVDEISSQATLAVEQEDEDYFTNIIDSLLKKLFEFFGPIFNEFEIDVDPKIYEMMKEKREKNLLFSIIKFLHDKLKELVKKIFSRDLSFNERLAKEIKELEEKLAGGGLSPDEFARVLERLEALQGLKLKLQMFLVGWLVNMFAEIFAVDLVAAIEHKEQRATEGKKEEKEASKEVCEDVERKVDEKKPQIIVPIPLFNTSPIFARSIVLTKPELDLFSKPIKDLVDSLPKQVINNENNKSSQESKVKGAKPKPFVAACPTAPKQPVVNGIKFYSEGPGRSAGRDRNSSGSVNNINGIGTMSTNEQKMNDLCTKLKEKVAKRNTQRKCVEGSTTDVKHDYPIDTWQGVSSEVTDVGVNNLKDQSVGRDGKTTGMSR